jgi:fibronectin type 3 domain-containing protein
MPGNGQISLSWNPSNGATGYTVKRSATSGGPYGIIATGVTITTHLDATVTNGTTYYYVVSASNIAGEGANSSEVPATPLPPPTAPTGLDAVPAPLQVTLYWTATPAAATYNVKRSTLMWGPYSTVATAVTATTHIDPDLTNGMTYYYVVSGVNGGGEGPDSSQIVTTLNLPAAPWQFQIVNRARNSLTWIWYPQEGEGYFELHDAAHVVKATIPRNSLSFIEEGLSENTSHDRHLHAVNGFGASDVSSQLTNATLTRDSTADDFIMIPISGNRIDLLFAQPANPYVGNTGIDLERSTDGINFSVAPANYLSAYSRSDLSVLGNTTYHYRFQYRNQQGYRTVPSPSRSITTPVTPPTFTGTPLSSSVIRWNWSSVVDAVSYEIHDEFHNLMTTLAPPTVQYDEPTLLENTLYTRHVHSINVLGEDLQSADHSVYTTTRTPGLSDFSLTCPSSTQARITVVPPLNPTTGTTGVLVERWMGSSWGLIWNAGGQYIASDFNNLTPGTLYSYRIRFKNAADVLSDYSPSKEITTPTLPPPVITTLSKKTRNTTLVVQGTADGMETITVYFNGTLDGTAVNTSGSWSYAVVKPEGSYGVTAISSNGDASSAPSNAITLTIDVTAPMAPTRIRTLAYSAVVDVEWDPSVSPDAVGYNVWRRPTSGGAWTLLNTTGMVLGTKYRDNGGNGSLTNGVSYTYGVEAVDDAQP